MFDGLYVLAILTIWLSIGMMLVTVVGGIYFILTHLHKTSSTTLPALTSYPRVTVVIPAHNEERVIQATVRAVLRSNYPVDKLELLIYADNCDDQTATRARAVLNESEFVGRTAQVIERRGTGGKAGVLNDALAIARGTYLGVYDADAAPERNALYFLVQKVLEDPQRYAAAFGRNKTRNYQQNFLTRSIHLEVITTQRIQHTGMWQLFRIGRIPGTNFIIEKRAVQAVGGWDNGALTEDTALSFKLMRAGKLIALASRSEAFQQEPETLFAYYHQRKRWARGNYEVIFGNFKHLFDRTPWRVKLEVFYYLCVYLWFAAAIIISNGLFVTNLVLAGLRFAGLDIPLLVNVSEPLAVLFLVNWLLMFYLYLLQINIALASDYGQATLINFGYSVVSYFTYAQLFIIVSLAAMGNLVWGRLTGRRQTKWYKTERF